MFMPFPSSEYEDSKKYKRLKLWNDKYPDGAFSYFKSLEILAKECKDDHLTAKGQQIVINKINEIVDYLKDSGIEKLDLELHETTEEEYQEYINRYTKKYEEAKDEYVNGNSSFIY